MADKISEYASSLDIYGFDSDKKILLNNLDKEKLNQLEEKMLAKTQGMTKKDQSKQDIVYFLIDIAKIQEDKEKYLRLCKIFKGILRDSEIDYLQKKFGDY